MSSIIFICSKVEINLADIVNTGHLQEILDPAAGSSWLVSSRLVFRLYTILSALPVQHDDLRQKIDKHMSELSGADDKVTSEQPSGPSAENEWHLPQIVPLTLQPGPSKCLHAVRLESCFVMCKSQAFLPSIHPAPFTRGKMMIIKLYHDGLHSLCIDETSPDRDSTN